MTELDRLQELLTDQYAAWRTNPAVDLDDPTVKFVGDLAQLVIGLVAIQQGTERRVSRAEKCCPSYPNGPQWGHEWSCPKCPD